jgi:hypothetical protein
MGNVISLQAIRELKESKTQDKAYEETIRLMNKLELLEEMVRFQEERTSLGHLSPSLMVRGRILFKALEHSAETQELRLLTRSYRRHLEYELAAFLKNPSQPLQGEAAES